MSVQKIKDAFKRFVKEAFEDAPAPEKVEIKLVNGEVIEVDKLDIGGVVMQNGTPVADGEYNLETGEKIVVAGGVISEVKPVEEDMQEDPKDEPKPNEEVAQLSKDIFSALEKMQKSIEEKFLTLEKKQSQFETSFKDLSGVVENFADETPTKPTHVDWDSLTEREKYRLSKGK